MAFIQDIKPPLNKTETFSLKDFSGGMNNRSEQLALNEGSIVKNLVFSDEIILETRPGQKYYNEVVYDGDVIYIDEYKPYKEPNQLVVGTATTLYIGNKTIPLTGKPNGVNYQGRYYFSDGSKLKVYGKYDGTDGIYNKYIGTKIVDYSFFDVVTPTEGHPQLPVEHVKGVTTVDYTLGKVYYEPCLNEFSDALKAPNVVPDSVKFLAVHNGRLICSGHNEDDDNVFMSDIQNPLYFPVALPIQIPPTSDKITSLHVFDNSLIIGREYDMYRIIGSTNRPESGSEKHQLKRINSHTGIASHSAVSIAHNYLIFLGSDGNVYGMQNAKVSEKDLATTILSKSIDLFKEPINVKREDFKNASAYFNKDEWYLSIGDKIMVYSYRHMAWVMLCNLEAKSLYSFDSEWIWGRGSRLAMYDKDSYLDFGYPYESLFKSRLFDMGDANRFKQFREFFIVAHTYEKGIFSDIYVTFEVDYTETKDRFIVSNQISRWGESKFGERFISRNINESIPFIIGKRGRSIRFIVKNGYYESGTIPTRIDAISNVDNLLNYPGKKDGTLVKVIDEGIYYLYMKREWIAMSNEEMNQKMKVYQLNGDYEFRGKR